jgi:hypothetical protein
MNISRSDVAIDRRLNNPRHLLRGLLAAALPSPPGPAPPLRKVDRTMLRRNRIAVIVALVAFVALPAFAQITFPTPNSAVSAVGQVQICVNAAGVAVGCQGVTVIGGFSGADTTTAAATLTGTAGKTTYICGFQVNGLGLTTGATVNVAVASLLGGNTLNFAYIFPTGATVATTPIQATFQPCLPANAVGSSLTVTVPGGAGNTSTNIGAWGFQL